MRANNQSERHHRIVTSPPRCKTCAIRKMALFRSVPRELIDWVEKYRSHQYYLRPKDFLYREGDEVSEVFTLFSGWVKLFKTLPDGKTFVMRFSLAGDFLGFQSNLRGPLNHSIQALTDVHVCSFPKAKFGELLKARPEIGSELTSITVRDLGLCHEHQLNTARKSAEERVANLLLELYYRVSDLQHSAENTIDIPITQVDIADAVGITQVHVNRVLKKLKESGLVSCKNHKLSILDEKKLSALGQFNPDILQRYSFG